jgi:hypothetical protein
VPSARKQLRCANGFAAQFQNGFAVQNSFAEQNGCSVQQLRRAKINL